MKGKLLVLITALLILNPLFAQDIILDFSGKMEASGASVDLTDVTIENLTSGEIVELEAPFTFNLSQSLGVDPLSNPLSKQGFKSVYPNPFSDFVNIEFYTQGQGDTRIAVYNLLGQEVVSTTDSWEAGTHQFTFTAITDGLYFLTLEDNGKQYTQKVIAQKNTSGQASLKYGGMLQKQSILTANLVAQDPFFNPGDLLRFSGNAGSLRGSIYDSPEETTSYVFEFTDDYYKFDPYLIQTEFPSFVNILFSVTDINNRGVDYLINEDFKVLEDDNQISPTETFRYVKKLNQLPYTQKTVLMLDNSNSVTADLPAIKEAAVALIDLIADNQEIAVYSFSDNPTLLQDFTADTEALKAAINSIEPGFPSTNLYGSLITGLNSFNNSYTLDGIEEGYLIALTDGDDTQASSTLEQVIQARGQKRVFMVGLGNELNPEPLNEISYPGDYIPVNTVDELADAFEQINLDIIRFSNSFYFLKYLSPKRNATHTLQVEAVTNTNEEADRLIEGSFSANGFQSVFEGVYANVSPELPYGPEMIDVPFSVGPLNLELDLKAVSYLASEVPIYEWSIEENELAQLIVNEEDDSKMQVFIPFSATDRTQVVITLKDVANDFENEIILNFIDAKPIVSTDNINSINVRSAQVLSTIVSRGEAELLQYGVAVSTSQNFTLDDEPTLFYSTDLSSDEVFFNPISELNGDTTYYVKAFASNSYGFALGNELSFTTQSGTPLIRLISGVNELTATSATIPNDLVDTGGFPVTERGICYVNQNDSFTPTIDDNKAIDSNELGLVETLLEGLEPSQNYYYRAYAINELGISYSSSKPLFKTKDGVPFVNSTEDITDITLTTATGGGTVTENGADIIERGVCWSSTTNTPTIDDFSTIDGSGAGTFISELTDLTETTQYYVRAYAKSEFGIRYGTTKSFVTASLPLVETGTPNTITSKSFRLSNKATAYNGYAITQKGVVYSTEPDPDLDDSVLLNDGAASSYLSIVSNLERLTTYYVRAFASNEFGTVYGEEREVTTLEGLPILNTIEPYDIFVDNAKTGGQIVDRGHSELIEKGVVYSTETNPTLANSKATSDDSSSSYTITLTDLESQTTYYVRAYATNNEGTTYGEEYSFTTIASEFSGSIDFSSQSLVDQFGERGYTSITGNLRIIQGPINNLESLNTLKSVGNLYILNSSIENLTGLENLTSIVNLALTNNSKLINIDALKNVSSFLERIEIEANPLLENTNGLENIRGVGSSAGNTSKISIRDNASLLSINVPSITAVEGPLNISNNPSLTSISIPAITTMRDIFIEKNTNLTTLDLNQLNFANDLRIQDTSLSTLDGLSSLNQTGTLFLLRNNPLLEDIEGLSSLRIAQGYLGIMENTSLTNLDALNVLEGVSGNLQIERNTSLSNLCGLQTVLTYGGSGNLGGNYLVSGNAYNPTQQDIINGNCSN